MWATERGSIFVVIPPSPLLFLFVITDVRPTLKNAWAWQVGLRRNARWHLTWHWSWIHHLADVWNPLMGSAKQVLCMPPSNGLHSEAVPTCWTVWRKGCSVQAIAVSSGGKEVHRVVLGVWQYEQLPCFMSLLIDKRIVRVNCAYSDKFGLPVGHSTTKWAGFAFCSSLHMRHSKHHQPVTVQNRLT